MSLTAQTSQSSYITGPQPNVFLGALLSYPTATGTTPTNDGTKLSFASASSQFLNFGSQTFDMTKGFSVTCKFAFTGTAGTDEVILNFDSIRLTRSGTTGSIIFTYYNGTTAYSVTSTNTVAQGQVNTVTVLYTHSPVSLSIILNGVTTTSTPAAAATTPRTITNSYVGFPTTTGQNLFVAVAQLDGLRPSGAASSTDGITWTARTILPSSSTWSSVTCNQTTGVFVAVIDGPTTDAGYSTDGITWTTVTLPSSSRWFSVTANKTTGVFVAVTFSAAAASSTNGITWTARTLPSSQIWRSVTVNSNTGVFVAIAQSGDAASSTDGITWTARTLPEAGVWFSVTCNPTTGVFVAVDGFGRAASSTDGITWTARTTNPIPSWLSVTCNPTTGVFVAVPNSTNIGTWSTNGITWSPVTLPSSLTWNSVTVNPTTGVFVAIASGQTAASSTDGITWTARTLPSLLTWRSVTASTSVSSGNYLNGDIYSLNIYNRALTPAELSGPPAPSPWGIFTGTPLFNQLSQAATSSAVGAFSLRAVNGTTAKAVQVSATAPLPSFTSGATSIGSNSYSQSLTGYTFGGTGTYVTRGSSIYNTGTTEPWKAFDNSLTTWWETTAGLYNTLANGGGYTGTQTITIDGVPTSCEWITIQIPTGIVLSSYSMYARSGFTQRMPKNFKIAGSNDGTTWTTVDTETNQTTWTGQTPITFTTTSSTAYTYFALCVTAITSAGATNNLNVGQWTLNASWQTDFYADRLGNLLTAPVTGQPLTSWLGGSTGNVTTWYDQSGAGNHATQTTAANQPIIQKATKGPGYMVLVNGVNGTTSFGLNFGAYNLLNNTSYSTCGVVRRTASGATNNENYYLSGSGGVNAQDQNFHNGYRLTNQFTLAHYSDDMNVTIPSFTAAATEPINYNFSTLGTDKVGRIYSYSGGTLYPTPTSTRTFVGFLNHPIGASLSIGGGFRQFTGEIYEVLVFTQSLYDLDNTGGLITQVYQNQLSYTGT